MKKMILVTLMGLFAFASAGAKTKHKHHHHHKRHSRKKSSKAKLQAELDALPPFLAIDSTNNTAMNTVSYLLTIFERQLGKPYSRGANGPESFDCSGLVKFAFSFIGMELPRTAAEMGQTGMDVNKDSVQQGDLLFFTGSRFSLHKKPGHVGCVYKVDSGRIFMIHSSDQGVNITDINAGNYYRRRYLFARRVLNSDNKVDSALKPADRQAANSNN